MSVSFSPSQDCTRPFHATHRCTEEACEHVPFCRGQKPGGHQDCHACSKRQDALLELDRLGQFLLGSHCHKHERENVAPVLAETCPCEHARTEDEDGPTVQSGNYGHAFACVGALGQLFVARFARHNNWLGTVCGVEALSSLHRISQWYVLDPVPLQCSGSAVCRVERRRARRHDERNNKRRVFIVQPSR